MSIIITNPDSSNLLMTMLKNLKHTPPSPYSDAKTRTKTDAKLTEPAHPRHWNAANHAPHRSTNHTTFTIFFGANETETRKKYDFLPIWSPSAMIRRSEVWIGFWTVSPTATSEDGFEFRNPENSDFTNLWEFKFQMLEFKFQGITSAERIIFLEDYIHEIYKRFQFISYTNYNFYFKKAHSRGKKIYF